MEEIITKQKLEIAKEKLQLLKTQSKNTQMSIRTTLELASQIRDSISNDKDVTEFCDTSKEYALQRQILLDDIRKMQLNIIEKHTRQYKDIEDFDGNIKDFDKAKQDLVAMIKDEQSLQMFAETESPELFITIEDSKIHEETLRKTADDCKNGRYEVLIMGDFQSGKSTTIDALCDGRHVSAIGKGIPTSAVLVTVTYAEEEHVDIHWRTKEQLKKIITKIAQYFPKYDFDNFDLDKPQARAELAAFINAVRTSDECPNVSDGNAKFLMLCDFILHFYDTDKLAKQKEAQQTSPNPAEITKFPDKSEADWKEKGVEGFTIEEVLFVFIEEVNCFVHSETLRKLNCTIIDSPGLFNSSYDTMVTENAMVKAHAIMYVLPYEKAINQDICKSLYNIKDNYSDVHRKLFIVNNVTPCKYEVYESNCAKIKNMFGAEKNVYPYDAKLAYLLQVKRLFDTGMASKKDYQHLMSVIEKSYNGSKTVVYDTFDEAWAVHIADYAGALKGKFARILQGYIEEGLQESGFIDMTIALYNFIKDNKAYAVIVPNGLASMKRELISVKNSLYRIYIKQYIADDENNEKLWESRIKKANEFHNYVSKTAKETLFGKQEAGSLCQRMTEQEYFKLFTSDFYSELSETVAGVLYDNKEKLLFTKSIFKKEEYKKKFIELFTPLIEMKIKELIDRKVSYLYRMLESEQDITVRDTFVPEMKNLENTLEKEWILRYKDDEEMQKMQDFLSIPKNLKSKQADNVHDAINNTSPLLGSGNSSILLSGLVIEISTLIAGIASMIAGYITAILWDPTGISQTAAILTGLLLGIGGTIITFFSPDAIRNKFITKLSKKLLPKINNFETTVSFRKVVNKHMKSIFEQYLSRLSIDIQKMKNERDLALRTTTDRETMCFRSVEATMQLNKQLLTYDDYKQTHLINDETT